MPVAGAGLEQCYNAQAAVVAAESLLVIAVDVVQIAPMLQKVDALPEQLCRPETLLADNDYFSEPLIATRRQPHHPSSRERFAAPPPAPENLGLRHRKANNSTLCANRPRSRCSVSSNR